MFTSAREALAGIINSRAARRLFRGWSLAHQDELDANWDRSKGEEPLQRIAALD
jgi:hypothetical protein